MRVYASFDAFPAPKGSATHIAAFAAALGRAHGPLDLVTIEPGPAYATPLHQLELGSRVRHVPLAARGKTLIDRVLEFRRNLLGWWGERRAELVHVRSIYEGYPLVQRDACERLVYEVNGFPSIELKYHYPAVADDRELMAKLEAQEQRCLERADLVLTPSRVTGELLVQRGVEPSRLRVIPNGVDLSLWDYQEPAPREERPLRLLYAGTLTSWQGVFVAIEALRLYRRDFEATLTLVGPARKRQRRRIQDRVHDLGLSEVVQLLPAQPRQELVRLHHEHDLALAPLLSNDRNRVQGCCPLKVLEAMAAGCPLVASDMPVVSDLARNEVEALLVRPGCAKSLKDGFLRLRAKPELGLRLAQAARARIEAEFTWEGANRALLQAYSDLVPTT